MKNSVNPLEQLEQIPTGAVKQLVKLPGNIVKQGFNSLLAKKPVSTTQNKVDPLTGLSIPSEAQIQQLKQQEAKRKMSGLTMMRQSLASQNPQKSQPPQYVSGKPGFDLQKAMGLDPFAQKKKELPPPVAAVKQKHSTGERKHGVGG